MTPFREGLQLELPFATQEQSVLARDAADFPYPPIRPTTRTAFARACRAIKDWPRGDRPRDKLLDRGPAPLRNAELLAIVLRTDTRGRTALDQARTLLAHCDGDWRRLGMVGAGDLRQYGLGPVQATQILAVVEIA